MLIEQIADGETIEEAVAAAKAKLGAPEDAIFHTEILEVPKKKVLGLFGGSAAKVKVSYEAPDKSAPKPSKKDVKPRPMPSPKQAPANKPKAEPKKAPAPKPVPVEKKEAEPKPEKNRVPVEIASSPFLVCAENYVKTIALGMGVEKCDISAFKVSDDEIVLELDCGEDYGILIGKWGDTLDAIQYLTRLATNRLKEADGPNPRISINIGNYRQKRDKYLREFAGKKAAAVRKFGRNVTLDPMNPYERRIIHTAIQDVEGVTSYSIGSEGDRKVVITLSDGVRPLKPQRGGRGGRSGGNRSSRPSPKVEAPSREPKTDEGAKSVGRYGKLN